MSFKLRLFGAPQRQLDNEPTWTPLPLDYRGALLAYLAYTGTWVNRDQCVMLFWPDVNETRAKANLRQLVSRTKELPLAHFLESNRKNIGWFIESDVAAFLAASERKDWKTALELASKPLCDGLNYVPVGIQAWLELERDSLATKLRTIRHTHSKELFDAGKYEEAATIIEPLISQKLVSEDSFQNYLRYLYLAGKRSEALQAYKNFATELKTELELEPLPETKALVATIEASQKLVLLPIHNKHTKAEIPLSLLHPPKLIGRDDALQTLKDSRSNLIIIKGEAGIGKTRFVETVYTERYTLSCEESLKHIPYHPIVDFIKSQLALDVPIPDLGYYQNDLARLIPELATAKPDMIDPMVGQIRLLEAIALFIEGIAKDTNTPIVIDDLQWADSKTIEVFAFLAQRQVTSALTIVLSYRTEETGSELLSLVNSLNDTSILTIELDALNNDQLRSFLEEDLALVTPELNAFCDWIGSATSGNPMFVLELLKSLYESGSIRPLESDTTKLELFAPVKEVKSATNLKSQLSKRLTHLIHQRIDKLTPEAKRLLQSMSAASELSSQYLSQVSGLSDWAMMDAFDELKSAGFLSDTNFKHDILREITYKSLSSVNRQLIHRRIATLIDNSLDDALTAEHWYAAGEIDKALDYWYIAAQNRQDSELYDSAITILDRALQTTNKDTTKHSLFQANLYNLIGKHEPAFQILESLITTAIKTPADRVRYNRNMGMALITRGKLSEAESYLAIADNICDAPAVNNLDDEEIFLTKMQLALMRGMMGNIEYTEKTLIAITKNGNYNVSVYSQSQAQFHLAALYAHSNRITEAKIIFDANLKLLEEDNSIYFLMLHSYFYLNYYLHIKDTNVAHLINRAQKFLARGISLGAPLLLESIIDTYIAQGDLKSAENYLEELVKQNYPLNISAVWARKAKLYSITNHPQATENAIRMAIKTLETNFYLDTVAVTVTLLLSFGNKAINKKIQEKIEFVRHAPVLFNYKAELDKALEAYDGGLEPYQPAIYAAIQKQNAKQTKTKFCTNS